MDAALGWIGDIIKTLIKFVPHIVHVRATHAGVKFVRAKTRVIGPGIHWYWPLVTYPFIYPTVRQVLPLEQQLVRTKDGRTVVVDGVVVYFISNIETFLVDNYEAEASLTEVALAGIRAAILDLTLDEIFSGRVKLDKRLTKEVGESLEEYGVTVEFAKLQSCAEGAVLIHAGNMIGVSQVGGE
jgi:regulator of protease activity HflC (stomatin/prohibitin superfamily)